MSLFVRRLAVVVAVALAPMAYVTAVSPQVISAQPPDCGPGNWWDPGANACQPGAPPPPPDCGRGNWWNPYTNACQPVSPSFHGYAYNSSTAIGSPWRTS